MPLFPSDFKKFKHVSSDDTSTTLRHEKGHELKIAHKALSPKMRAQLEALSEGGIVGAAKEKYKESAKKGDLGTGPRIEQEDLEIKEQKAQEQKRNIGREDIPGANSPSQKAAQEEFDKKHKNQIQEPKAETQMANGGKVNNPETCMNCGGPVHMYAEGDMVQGTPVDKETEEARQIYNQLKSGPNDAFSMAKGAPPVDETNMFGPNGETPKVIDADTWAQARQQQTKTQADNAAKTAAAQQAIIAQNQVRTDAGMAPLPVPDVPVAPQIDTTAQEPTTAASLAPTDVAQTPEQASSPTSPKLPTSQEALTQGYTQGMQGINALATAQGNLGNANAETLKKSVEIQQGIQAQYKADSDKLELERQNLMHDIKEGHVDPDKFWDKNSRIAAGIGMILAGFNPTNSPNAAINYLKFQMEQNLEAQKNNLSSKQNLLSANLQQFGNLRQAMDMTRVMQADVVKSQLETAAAKATSPLAKAAALEAASKLNMEYAPLIQKIASQTTLNTVSQAVQQDPSKLNDMINAVAAIDPEKAKDLRSRAIYDATGKPVGLANTPKDAEHLKEVEDRRTSIKTNVKELIRLVKNKGTFEMVGSHNADLEMRLDQVATDMAKLQDPESIARPGEVELVKKSLMQTGLTTRNETAIKMLENFYGTVDTRANQQYTTRGMRAPVSKPLTQPMDAATKQKALKWAQSNPNDPRAAQILKTLGQ